MQSNELDRLAASSSYSEHPPSCATLSATISRPELSALLSSLRASAMRLGDDSDSLAGSLQEQCEGRTANQHGASSGQWTADQERDTAMDRLLQGAQVVVVCDCDDAKRRILAAFVDLPGFSIRTGSISQVSNASHRLHPEQQNSNNGALGSNSSLITLLIAGRYPRDEAFASCETESDLGWPLENHIPESHDAVPNKFSFLGGLTQGALKRIKSYVDVHLADQISLIDLAEIADLSVCHFGRAFKQSVGVTPHRYLMGRRIAQAARLLATANDSISEIAFTTGFADQSHMTRAFVKMMGTTPRNYRRNFR